MVNNDTKIDKATQNVNIKLLVPVSEYGSIPIKLFINTKLKTLDTLTSNSPLPSTSLPKLAIKREATISSTKSASSSSKIKSSSSSCSDPPKRKKARTKDTKFSSIKREKLI
jgi:hypothetical protein